MSYTSWRNGMDPPSRLRRFWRAGGGWGGVGSGGERAEGEVEPRTAGGEEGEVMGMPENAAALVRREFEELTPWGLFPKECE